MKHSPCLARHSGRTPVLGRILNFLMSVTFITLAASSSASAQAPAPILVAYAGQNETVGPMWVGIEKGTFKKYGLDVRLVQLRTGSLSMATLSSGQVQYNYGSPGNALSAEHEPDWKRRAAELPLLIILGLMILRRRASRLELVHSAPAD